MADNSYDPIMSNIATVLTVAIPFVVVLILAASQRILRERKITNARDKANG